MSASIATTERVNRTMRALQDDELDVVRGAGQAVTFTYTITNSPSFRGGVGSNETITIHGGRTE